MSKTGRLSSDVASLKLCYDLFLMDHGFLVFSEHIGAAEIKARIKNLEEKVFYVAVSGQMKAGKSTLINAFLFGREVLPADDTVMTAKNARILYGKDESIDVEFYSADDWASVKKHYEKSGEADFQAFTSELDSLRRQGIKEGDYIHSSGRHDRGLKTSRLGEFVTPVSKGGKYSPFVKMVTIKFPDEWLRHITIVDTPGVNDPLKFREDITKKWISEAGAVVYVTYAGQPLSSPDRSFVCEYLSHVPPERKIFAINKSDILESEQDRSDVKEYVAQFSQDSNEMIAHAFSDTSAMVLTSGLSGLYKKNPRSYPKFDKTFGNYLESMDDGLEQLRGLIEEKIVQNVGDSFIDDHKHFIRDVLGKSERYLSRIDAECKDKEVLARKGLDQLEQEKKFNIGKRQKIRAQALEFESVVNDYRGRIALVGEAFQKQQRQLFVDGCIEAVKRGDSRDLFGSTTWERALAKGFRAFRNIDIVISEFKIRELLPTIADFNSKLNVFVAQIGDIVGGNSGLEISQYVFEVDFSGIAGGRKWERSVESEIKDDLKFWQHWFNTNKSFDAVLKRVEEEAPRIFDESVKAACEEAKRMVGSSSKESREILEVSAKAHLEKIDAVLEALVASESSRKMENDRIADERRAVDSYRHALMKVQGSVNEALRGCHV